MDSFRHLHENIQRIQKEAKTNPDYEQDTDGIPYSTEDNVLSSAIDAAKQQFGANFENIKAPMLYYPSDGDIVFSGEINSLNDAKFQFRYKDPDGEGCFVWVNPLHLTESNLNVLRKVYGTFKNWKQQLDTSDDKKPMGMRNNDESDNE